MKKIAIIGIAANMPICSTIREKLPDYEIKFIEDNETVFNREMPVKVSPVLKFDLSKKERIQPQRGIPCPKPWKKKFKQK